MTTLLLPDVERLVTSYLRSVPELDPLIGDRVFTAFPAQAGEGPLLLVQRIGGIPPLSHPLVVDEAQLQLDAYGGPRATAWAVLSTAIAALDDLEGKVRAEGYVSAVRQGAIRWQPDETFTPHRPRFITDVTLTTRPAVVPAARQPELAGVGTAGELSVE